ncbi:MAG: hypothetical protein MRK02_11040 [Candidatus Scalindua sp.]|nr:hypothetical protein [Candidatus Scalindua sp.]
MIEKSTSKTTSKYTVLRVCNYDAYNSVDTEADQQTSQQATSKRPASDHIQECKEYKENKKTLVKQSLTKKPLPLSPLQILWNSESVSLPKVKSNSKQRQSKECRRLKERSFEDWKIIFRRINETPFLFGGGESGWKATYDWIMKNEIHSTRVLESAYGEPVGKKVKKLVI